MTKRAAIILAGGKAHRFQCKREEWQDKALAKLLGKPLLIHVVENARGVVDEVVVCVNDETRKTKYADALKKHNTVNVKLVVDEEISHVSGPNVAILTGLKSTKADLCVTLPCDMPLLKPKIIKYLFDTRADAQVAVPMWPNGRIETLVMILERGKAAEIIETLCQLRRPRGIDIIRGASKVLFISPLAEMRALDPKLKSFVNVNCPEDLSKLKIRPAHGIITENFEATLGALVMPELQHLREASALRNENEFAEASTIFSSCAAKLEKQKSSFWGGISREKEGETLLAWSQLQEEPEIAAKLDFKGKNAFLAAATNYMLEAKVHFEGNCRFLADRARADKAWCESWVMDKTEPGDMHPSNY
jgi:molybdopterin-guanine dinucleotide biosynthesis protein A